MITHTIEAFVDCQQQQQQQQTPIEYDDHYAEEDPFVVDGCEGLYRDYLRVSIKTIRSKLQAPKSKRKGPRGGVSTPFPVKLYEMLLGVQKEGLESLVSWQPHGRCFLIHCSASFVSDILPRYFKQSKLTSFQRQLNLYGFQRIMTGRDRGGYYHPLFLRGRPDICKVMLRTRVKGGAAAIVPTTDVILASDSSRKSFYTLPTCPPANVSNVTCGHVTEDASSDENESVGSIVQEVVVPQTMPVAQPQQLPPKQLVIGSGVKALHVHQDTEDVPSLIPTSGKKDMSRVNSLALLMSILPMEDKPPLQDRNVPNPLLSLPKDDPEWGFFEGQTFTCIPEETQTAFETALMHHVLQ